MRPTGVSIALPIIVAAAMTVGTAVLGQDDGPTGYVISDVTVVDVEAGRLRPHRTVLIDGERIVRIAGSDGVTIPDGSQRIDGRGLFLIPGLFDAHVHFIDPQNYGPLLIAHGRIEGLGGGGRRARVFVTV